MIFFNITESVCLTSSFSVFLCGSGSSTGISIGDLRCTGLCSCGIPFPAERFSFLLARLLLGLSSEKKSSETSTPAASRYLCSGVLKRKIATRHAIAARRKKFEKANASSLSSPAASVIFLFAVVLLCFDSAMYRLSLSLRFPLRYGVTVLSTELFLNYSFSPSINASTA